MISRSFTTCIFTRSLFGHFCQLAVAWWFSCQKTKTAESKLQPHEKLMKVITFDETEP